MVGVTNRPGSKNLRGFTLPAPCANRSRDVPSSVTAAGGRHHGRLDPFGVQFGCTPVMNAARPAMCGEAIDVPE